MKIIGLDGKQYNLSLNKKARNKVSSYHEKARILLNKIFNHDNIYEEVFLGGSKKYNSKSLYADFLIPSHHVIIEVQGQQHIEQTSFFHDSKLDFLSSKKRDRIKQEWAMLNGFIFIELMYNEIDDWEKIILAGISE